MNETRIGFFRRFIYSMTSFDKYRLFLRQSTSKAVVYLLLTAFIYSAATFVPVIYESGRFFDQLAANIETSIPDFRFADGRLEVYGEMPIIMDGDSYAIIIDTSLGADESILDEYDTAMLITSDKIIQKNFANKRTTDLGVFQGIELTRDSIRQALPLMKPLLIFAYIFYAIFFICGKFISALIVSVPGMIINSARNTGMSYRSIFKFSVYAMTLPMLLCTILDLIPVNIPFIWILFYIISIIYVYGAIGSVRKEIDRSMGSGNPS